jgi:hypothetical protein
MKIQAVLLLICIFQGVLNIGTRCPPCYLLNSKNDGISQAVQQSIGKTCSVKCNPDVASTTCTKKFYSLNVVLEDDAYTRYCNGEKCECKKVRDLAVAAGDSRVVEAVSVITSVCNSQTFPNCKKQTYWVWSGGVKFTKKELKQMGYSVNYETEEDD